MSSKFNLQEDRKQDILQKSRDIFKQQLSNNVVVDFGRITRIAEGVAYVDLFSLNETGKQRTVLAELLTTALFRPKGGDVCMLIYPNTPIESLLKQTVYFEASAYDSRCIKCLPIYPYAEGDEIAWSRVGSNLALNSKSWSLDFASDTISFLSDLTNLTISPTTFDFSSGGGSYSFVVDEQGNWSNETGVKYDVQNEVWNWKNRVKQNVDGSITIEGAAGVNDSNESFGQNIISLETDGSVKIRAGVDKDGEAKSELVVGADGSIQITNTSQYTIEGVGVTIDGTDGKVSIKNGEYSLADAFNDLITVLDKFATQGSPAAHTAVPGQFTELQQNLQKFLE